MSTDVEDWPDWKLLLAKLAILWCAFCGVVALILVVGISVVAVIR